LYPFRTEIHYPTADRYWQSVYHHYDLSPKPDDAILTLGSSLARIAAKDYWHKLLPNFQQNPPEMKLDIQSSLKELSVYLMDDRVAGILVDFDIRVGDEFKASAQTWFKLQNWMNLEPWSSEIDKYHTRIQVSC